MLRRFPGAAPSEKPWRRCINSKLFAGFVSPARTAGGGRTSKGIPATVHVGQCIWLEPSGRGLAGFEQRYPKGLALASGRYYVDRDAHASGAGDPPVRRRSQAKPDYQARRSGRRSGRPGPPPQGPAGESARHGWPETLRSKLDSQDPAIPDPPRPPSRGDLSKLPVSLKVLPEKPLLLGTWHKSGRQPKGPHSWRLRDTIQTADLKILRGRGSPVWEFTRGLPDGRRSRQPRRFAGGGDLPGRSFRLSPGGRTGSSTTSVIVDKFASRSAQTEPSESRSRTTAAGATAIRRGRLPTNSAWYAGLWHHHQVNLSGCTERRGAGTRDGDGYALPDTLGRRTHTAIEAAHKARCSAPTTGRRRHQEGGSRHICFSQYRY